MGKKRLHIAYLFGILAFALGVYTYKLASIPNGFYVDEATVAYNAISIVETGKDAFGQPYPILFRLLGSYTPPLFIYLASLFVALLGNSVFTFRFISAIAMLVSTYFLYLLMVELRSQKNKAIVLVTVFFYAISPWTVFNARLGYEVALAYALFNIGAYFLWTALKSPKNFVWGALYMSLATYAAHTQRFLAPILMLFYIFTFQKEIARKPNFKYLKIAFWAIVITQVPHFLVITTPAFWVKNQRLLEQPAGQILGSILNQTFAYLSPKSIFFQPTDIDLQHTVPGISVMYDFLVIPYALGLYLLYKRHKEKGVKFVILLFATSLLPAILSGQFESIQRALPFLLPVMLTIGLGLDAIYQKLKPALFWLLMAAFTFYGLFSLYRSYFILFPRERALAWNWGYSQLSDFVKEKPQEKFVIDNSRNPRNYVLLLYFLDYPPQAYQEEVNPIYTSDYYRSLPPETSYAFGNVEVRPVDWKTDTCKDQVLIGDALTISTDQAKEHVLTEVYELKDGNNQVVFVGYKTNPDQKCL